MKKSERQSKIIEIIQNNEVKTQEELIDLLRESGIDVAQPTISRDIKELNLIKTVSLDGVQRYSVYIEDIPNQNININETTENQFNYFNRTRTVFQQSVVSIKRAYFLIVINTLPGMAQAAAHAIDLLNWPTIVGTIAGDDTIFVAVESERDVEPLLERFKSLME